ncbi:hypothetical protein GTQ34_05675 [Muricauda sp. JGD-17]|uniref:Apea-like HEPN domain-containing protein n=1 Tax=Flagellimonas ochracea TaxID=2696472 RepID=A0A964WX36_9FLAO|nr:HEPN domain-containing protein [Allomuricauda ochracea]NAY91403.1 hypothetical protein [Allomuricauda ochracea]
MTSRLGPYETLLKIDIVDFQDYVQLKHFGIRKLSYKEQCALFDLESFDVDEHKEVKNWKPKSPDKKKNRLKYLDGYSRQDWEELIGSEYYILCDKLENVESILDAFRLYKLGYVVATFSKSQRYDACQFHYPRFIKVSKAGLLKINVSELKEIENLFLEIRSISNKKIKLNLERFINAPNTYHHSYINLVGILESLLTGNDNGELKFRFALYMNHTLKNAIKSEIEIDFITAKKLYDIRSSLVHSGVSKKFSKELYLLLRDITREILVWSIYNPNYNAEDDFLKTTFPLKK